MWEGQVTLSQTAKVRKGTQQLDTQPETSGIQLRLVFVVMVLLIFDRLLGVLPRTSSTVWLSVSFFFHQCFCVRSEHGKSEAALRFCVQEAVKGATTNNLCVK